jgi:hypothetical protein
MWSVEHFESLYGGIDAIHTAFYEEYSLGTLARLVMCIGMQESTGDFLLGYPYAQSQGLMQVSPASVLSDFDTYGQIIFNPYTGSNLIPGQVDITDPGTSVMLWGWYGNGAAHTGVSMAEYSNREAWNIKAYRRRPNLGHAMLAWYAGPSASLDNKDTKKQFIDYVHRILDYWVAAGFGSEGDMYKLMRRRLQGNITHVKTQTSDDAPEDPLLDILI